MSFSLRDFVGESNLIEGIRRSPTDEEMRAHEVFLELPAIDIEHLEDFVDVVAGAKLRRRPGMCVRVGRHVPVPGGPAVVSELDRVLKIVRGCPSSPYSVHRRYEMLHPFMDGNGRSGRVLWLWQMGGIENAPLGFLHHWYYQSLEALRN